MSDAIKHECGIALLRLKKPLQFYKDKYGSAFYGIQKMYLLMEKQHNRKSAIPHSCFIASLIILCCFAYFFFDLGY